MVNLLNGEQGRPEFKLVIFVVIQKHFPKRIFWNALNSDQIERSLPHM